MLIEQLLQTALDKRASDLHLSAGMPPLLRIHGELNALPMAPLADDALKAMLYTIMQPALQQQFTQQLDLDFAYSLTASLTASLTTDARFRVNVYQQQRGIAAVFRLIPTTPPSMDALQLPDVLRSLIEKSHGLLLITGATGSGKSTTLAALLHHLNDQQALHIITIEDPIEFIHTSQRSLISQREVHTHVGGFQAALRAALREDPDVICVAELRDVETIRLALTAAETGHLVLATLHTASAPKTIDRIIDVFPGNEKDAIRTMLSESLLGVVAQRLMRCDNGRQAEFEILVATPAIRHLIRENKVAQIYSTMQTGRELGMCTFANKD